MKKWRKAILIDCLILAVTLVTVGICLELPILAVLGGAVLGGCIPVIIIAIVHMVVRCE